MSTSENPHLPLKAVRAGVALEQARMVAVLVHGRDQDEQVMLDVVERLDLPDVGYLLPVATQNTWYAGRHFDPVSANEPEVSWALDACDAALALARDAGVPERRTVLAGFSQGACLSAELAARRPRPLAGVGVLTGCLLGPLGDQATPAAVAVCPSSWARARSTNGSSFATSRRPRGRSKRPARRSSWKPRTTRFTRSATGRSPGCEGCSPAGERASVRWLRSSTIQREGLTSAEREEQERCRIPASYGAPTT